MNYSEKNLELANTLQDMVYIIKGSRSLLGSLDLRARQENFLYENDILQHNILGDITKKAIADEQTRYEMEQLSKKLYNTTINSGIFTSGFDVISQLDQKQYESALKYIESENRKSEKDSSPNGPADQKLVFNPITNTLEIYKKEYPKTLEEFKAQTVETLIGHGVNIDLQDIGRQQTRIKSVKTIVESGVSRLSNELKRSVNSNVKWALSYIRSAFDGINKN